MQYYFNIDNCSVKYSRYHNRKFSTANTLLMGISNNRRYYTNVYTSIWSILLRLIDGSMNYELNIRDFVNIINNIAFAQMVNNI